MAQTVFTLPDFVIIGANKAGTTSIAKYMEQNPQIGFSRIKEPMFFSTNPEQFRAAPGGASLAKPYFTATLDEYSRLFPADRPEVRVFGEASTAYMAVPQRSAQLMGKIVPQVRIIAVLREPVARAVSAYRMCRGQGIEPRPFEQVAAAAASCATVLPNHGVREYVRLGLYSQLLPPYLRIFPRRQILFLRYDDLERDPAGFMAQIDAFLGLDPFDYRTDRRYNTARDNQAEDIVVADGDRRRLQEFFRADVTRTAEITGLDLSEWMT
jgi:hypothetical protein